MALADFINRVTNMDCIEGMKQLPNNSIDMILCDLPYGVLDTKSPHTSWDKKIPFADLWEQYQRIAKPKAAIVLTCTHPFTLELLNSIPAGYKYQALVWYKSNGVGFLNAKRRHINQHEDILVIYKTPPIYNPQKYKIDERYINKGQAKRKQAQKYTQMFTVSGPASENYKYVDDGTRYPDTVLEFEDVLPFKSVWRKGMHPTEKPVDLFAYLVNSYTNPGAVVLDNCLGSGTTAVACLTSNRNFVGFETEKRYCDMSQERINAVLEIQKSLQEKDKILNQK